jgi:NTE family protein
MAAMALAGDGPPGSNITRPKIGVALAGGSALGLAHVGVLEWMEEHQIPIDYIAGTSMGGLVGGIYASGMSSAETIDLVKSIDWGLALSSATTYSNLSFRRKEDAAQFPMAFELGLKGGRLNIPSGLSPGEGVAIVIDRFAAPYGDMKSFDDLPTPFRCVASDLAKGKGIELDKGSLFDALRATMSLPAFFAPVRRDEMILVDGALTNNLPVDVVRRMGADIVIAVALDVPTDPNAFQSLLGVAGQSISYMIMANERANIAAADIVVMPALKGVAKSDYTRWDEFRKIGYAAAEQKARLLEKLQIPDEEYQAYVKMRQSRRRANAIKPSQVLIEGDIAPKLKAAVVSTLMPEPGTTLDREVLEEQMQKLTGAGRFETATYEFRSDQGKDTLIVRVQEKPYGPPLLRPSIYLDGVNGQGLRFGVGARLTFLDFGGPASEWRTDLSIGTFNRLETEYYYRIKGSKWFIAPRVGFSQEPFPLYNRDGDRIAQFTEKDFAGRADFGYAFGRKEELRFGHQYGYLKRNLDTGVLLPGQISGVYGVTDLMLRRDSRDNPLVPTRGSYMEGRASWYNRYPNVARQFHAFEGIIDHAKRVNSKHLILTRLSAAGTVSEAGLATLYRMGGLSNMSALARDQLLGSRMYYGHAYLLRSLRGDSFSTFGKFYGTIGYEAGRAWFPGGTAKPRHDGLIGLVGATQLGVIFLGGSIGDQGDRKILFRLGRGF